MCASCAPEEVREYRGTLTKPGKNSPYRDRPVEESLRLFEEMKAGKHPEGSMILRMKIDMASPNINMRDPAMYRILYKEHHRTGKKWCIYPMYDFAHPIGDALEGITHSLCSLEYEDHRPLYDWVVEHAQNMLPGHAPADRVQPPEPDPDHHVQALSAACWWKGGYVSGWDDPRMPTLCAHAPPGLHARAPFVTSSTASAWPRRTAPSIWRCWSTACARIWASKAPPRHGRGASPEGRSDRTGPEDRAEELEMENHPDHPEWGTHKVVLTREIYIEQEDFMEVPVKKYFRMFPGNEVRLKGAYIVRCDGCEKDEARSM